MQRTNVLLATLLAGCGSVESVVPDGGPGPDEDAAADADAAPAPDAPIDPGCVPADCESGLCDGDACATTRLEPCLDAAPDHATSIVVDVVTTFTPGVGWSTPAACDWTCDVDFCEVGDACEYAYTEQSFGTAPGNGSSWFGGDDGPNGPRHLGGGQRLRTTSAITMDRFAFYFTGALAHADGTPEAATVRLAFRNASGTILASSDVVVPADFAGGWVWWDIDYPLAAATDYYPTAWVIGGYDSGLHTGIGADTGNGYANGTRLHGSGLNDLTAWGNWTAVAGDTWDYLFRIRSPSACAP